ncbi:tail protein [Pseudomonas phage Almagne]|nr:tail protein [Pseudomonas phage Almagne]
MGNRVFNFQVETKPTGTTNLKTKQISFGDNYVQRAGDGLNGKSTNWNVVVDNDYAYVLAVRTFLDDHRGYMSFLWTPPNYPGPLRFICKTYTENPHVASQSKLNATFEQVFFP